MLKEGKRKRGKFMRHDGHACVALKATDCHPKCCDYFRAVAWQSAKFISECVHESESGIIFGCTRFNLILRVPFSSSSDERKSRRREKYRIQIRKLPIQELKLDLSLRHISAIHNAIHFQDNFPFRLILRKAS